MSDTEVDDNDPDVLRVEKALVDLAEFFDAVHIIATNYDGDKTETTLISRGKGNWQARYGSIRDQCSKWKNP